VRTLWLPQQLNRAVGSLEKLTGRGQEVSEALGSWCLTPLVPDRRAPQLLLQRHSTRGVVVLCQTHPQFYRQPHEQDIAARVIGQHKGACVQKLQHPPLPTHSCPSSSSMTSSSVTIPQTRCVGSNSPCCSTEFTTYTVQSASVAILRMPWALYCIELVPRSVVALRKTCAELRPACRHL
jgi:hypothetical protein